MKKVSIILGGAVLILLSGGAFAAAVGSVDGGRPTLHSTGSTPGDGGDGGAPCAALCAPPGNPGGPGGSENPNNPNNPDTPLNQALKACGDRLSQLRQVTAGEVQSLTVPAEIKLVPVCEYRRGSLTQPQLQLLDRGNVDGLGNVIAANPTLISQLGQQRYDANDVVGIALVKGPGAVVYVHRQ